MKIEEELICPESKADSREKSKAGTQDEGQSKGWKGRRMTVMRASKAEPIAADSQLQKFHDPRTVKQPTTHFLEN